MTIETICDELKRLGVREVILTEELGIPVVEFHGFDGEHFHVKATNAEFAAQDL